MKKLWISSLSLVIAAASYGQNLLTDRNFQRFDQVVHSRTTVQGLSQGKTSYLQLVGTVTQPDWNRSYSGGIRFTSVPNGLASADSGYREFQSTTTFTRLDPKGGMSNNQFGETLSYQFSNDPSVGQLSAFGVGLQYNYVDEFNNTAIPSLSGTYALTDSIDFVPTISDYLIRAADNNSNGAVPDFQLIYRLNSKIALSGDYVMATTINGPATAQLAGKYNLVASGLTAIKAEATWSAAYRPAFTGVFVYRFK